jgi:hypothetical protein
VFDADGDFIYEHDLEAGLWDGHGYDCSSPAAPCDCGDLTDLDESEAFGLAWLDEDGNFFDGLDELDDDDDIWTDLATYHYGR